MRELAIVAPLEQMLVGDTWSPGSLPLHITVLPNVRVSGDQVPQLIEMVSEVASTTPLLETRGESLEWFGPSQDIEVTTLAINAPLGNLHNRLLEAAIGLGAESVDPAFNAAGFRPHATRTIDGHEVTQGESVQLATIVVLDCTTQTRLALARAAFTA
jgi:2'-5' RNA ligase